MQFRSTRAKNRRGFTIVELMVASGVGLVVTGTTLLLMLESAKENRRGLADASVEQAAGDLQNRIARCIRGMSYNEGVVFGQPITGDDSAIIGYKRIIFARGPSPDYPREELRFDSTQGKVTYFSNTAQTNTAEVIAKNASSTVFRTVCFSPSFKPDGTPDNSLINVLIKLDDNGTSGREISCPEANPASVWRTFSVRMRNH